MGVNLHEGDFTAFQLFGQFYALFALFYQIYAKVYIFDPCNGKYENKLITDKTRMFMGLPWHT